MVLYRRNRLPGGVYFFTVTLRDRRSDYLLRYIDVLREAIRSVKAERPFTIEAMVVLPDHLHAIWRLPQDDDDYPARWRAIKARFVAGLRRQGVALQRNLRGEVSIWQSRYWEHTLRDEADFNAHCDYIHINPVKHGLANRAADWPHSSIHRFIADGLYPENWAGGDELTQVGEPE